LKLIDSCTWDEYEVGASVDGEGVSGGRGEEARHVLVHYHLVGFGDYGFGFEKERGDEPLDP